MLKLYREMMDLVQPTSKQDEALWAFTFVLVLTAFFSVGAWLGRSS